MRRSVFGRRRRLNRVFLPFLLLHHRLETKRGKDRLAQVAHAFAVLG
jgi:hypothetical protein